MNEDLEDAKKMIRSVLLSMKSGCSLAEFRREYSTVLGRPVPSSAFGFGRDDEAFLRSIPDVVKVQGYRGQDPFLTAVADETTRHIQKMVERQKPQKRKTAKVAQRWRQTPTANTNVSNSMWHYERPPRFLIQEKRLPRAVKVRLVDLVHKHREVSLSDFMPAFEKSYGERFHFQSFGFFTLQECIENIPELVMRTLDNRILIRLASAAAHHPGSEKVAQRPAGPKGTPRGNVNATALPNVKIPPVPVERKVPENVSSGHFNNSLSSNIKPVSVPVNRHVPQQYAQPVVCTSSGKKSLPSTTLGAPDVSYSVLDDGRVEKQRVNSSVDVKPPSQNKMCAGPVPIAMSSNIPQGNEPEEIPTFVLNNLKKIATMFPQGIWATDFPVLYEDVIHTDFDLHSLGYNDLSLFIDAVPHIFKREEIDDVKNNWLILPVDACKGLDPNSSTELVSSVVTNISRILQAYPEGIKLEEFLHIYSINCSEPLNIKAFGFNSIEVFLSSISSRVPLQISHSRDGKMVHLVQTPVARAFQFAPSTEVVPPDAVVPPACIPPARLPEDQDLSKYFEVYTSSIESPSLFYIQLKGPQYSEAMNTLYNQIETFYHSSEGIRYKMRNAHIKVGAVCVALWPSDDHWYRVKVISIPSMETVKVLYFDYGTKEEIPTGMLRYMRKEYSRLPAQALVSSLAYLSPAHGASMWDPRARSLMLRMCHDVPLMASVHSISDDGVLSLILCDTNDDRDTYINDVLLNEELAECVEATPAPQDSFQALQAQLFMQACASVVAPADLARVLQGLSLNIPSTPTIQPSPPVASSFVNAPTQPPKAQIKTPSPVESDVFGEEDDQFFDQFYSKVVSVMKRFVKRVMTQDGYIFHILIFEARPFVSCGDISNLIWSGQDSEYLVQRLQNREVKLPSLTIPETDNKELFSQIRRFFVKGCSKVGKTAQIFVYSLDSVIEILNLFGQPSEDLRNRIQGELISFNPRDPQWLELSEAEFPDEEDSSVATDDDKLNRLCLYDLLAMKESIRIRRTNKMRNMLTSNVDEVGKMEHLLDKVVDRIEQIKKICENYKYTSQQH